MDNGVSFVLQDSRNGAALARNRIGCSISKRDCRAHRSSSSPVGGRRAAHSRKRRAAAWPVTLNQRPSSDACRPPSTSPASHLLWRVEAQRAASASPYSLGRERVAPPQIHRVRSLRTASFFWRRFPVRGRCFLTPRRGHLTEICEMGVTISISDPGFSVSTPDLGSTRPGCRHNPPGQGYTASKGQRQQDGAGDGKMQRSGCRIHALRVRQFGWSFAKHDRKRHSQEHKWFLCPGSRACSTQTTFTRARGVISGVCSFSWVPSGATLIRSHCVAQRQQPDRLVMGVDNP
jgi:hypothetical protein